MQLFVVNVSIVVYRMHLLGILYRVTKAVCVCVCLPSVTIIPFKSAFWTGLHCLRYLIINCKIDLRLQEFVSLGASFSACLGQAFSLNVKHQASLSVLS